MVLFRNTLLDNKYFLKSYFYDKNENAVFENKLNYFSNTAFSLNLIFDLFSKIIAFFWKFSFYINKIIF